MKFDVTITLTDKETGNFYAEETHEDIEFPTVPNLLHWCNARWSYEKRKNNIDINYIEK